MLSFKFKDGFWLLGQRVTYVVVKKNFRGKPVQIWTGNIAFFLLNLRIGDLRTGVLEMVYTVHFPTASRFNRRAYKPWPGALPLYEYQSHWQAAGGMVV